LYLTIQTQMPFSPTPQAYLSSPQLKFARSYPLMSVIMFTSSRL